MLSEDAKSTLNYYFFFELLPAAVQEHGCMAGESLDSRVQRAPVVSARRQLIAQLHTTVGQRRGQNCGRIPIYDAQIFRQGIPAGWVPLSPQNIADMLRINRATVITLLKCLREGAQNLDNPET